MTGWLSADEAATALGIDRLLVETRMAAGALPFRGEGPERMISARDVDLLKAEMREQDAAMRLMYAEFDDTGVQQGR